MLRQRDSFALSLGASEKYHLYFLFISLDFKFLLHLFHLFRPTMPDKKKKKKKRSNSPPRQRRRGVSHKNETLNNWPEENMPIALAEYFQLLGINPNQKMSPVAKKYGIPITTFWKRVTDRVEGTGYQSGGARQPRVLGRGTYFSLANISLETMMNSPNVFHLTN